ncbi:hypothetical protein [Hymenobacter sp. UYAg731]
MVQLLASCQVVEPTPLVEPYAADLTDLLRCWKHSERCNTKLLPPPIIFRDSTRDSTGQLKQDFELRIAAKPLGLHHQIVRLPNPFDIKAHPLCTSVIFQHQLVALFASGGFACFHLSDFSRNKQLEAQLNALPFEQHWILNQQLIGWHQGAAYRFDTLRHDWQRYNGPTTFARLAKLFEDERFVCTTDCQSEFGGHVYFFDKRTGLTHYTTATCATTVWKQGGKYHLLTSLSSNAKSGVVPAPEKLPLIYQKYNPAQSWEYSDLPDLGPDPLVQRRFFYWVEMLGCFQWQQQQLYLVTWRETTFLAIIDHDIITVVDPLFVQSLENFGPSSVKYGPDLTLISLPHYEKGTYEEYSCLLAQGNIITKVEWGEQPARYSYCNY